MTTSDPRGTRRVLDYRRDGSGPWRRWLGRGLLCALAVAAAVIAYCTAAPHVRQATYLRAQRECAGYLADARQVVFEQGPGVFAAPRRPGEHPVWYWSGVQYPKDGPVGYLPRPWSAVGQDRPGVAFLHARRTKAGNERIVAVAFASAGDQSRYEWGGIFCVHYYGLPAGSSPGSRIAWVEYGGAFGWTLSERDHLKVFAGQPDPSDESHFTIEYELNGERGLIDGWLEDPLPPEFNAERDPWNPVYLRVQTGPLRDR